MTKKGEGDFSSAIDEVLLSGVDRLRKENRDLKKLLAVSRQISTLDLRKTLKLIMDHVVQIIRAQRGFLMLADDEGNLQISVAAKLDKETLDSEAFEISRSLAENVARTGKSERIRNVFEDARYRDNKSIVELRLKGIICVPLKTKRRVIGVIYVDTDRQSNRFSEKNMVFFEAFASQCNFKRHVS